MYVNVTDLDPGDIVWVEAPKNSAGKTTYDHRFVFLFRPQHYSAATFLTLVAIASATDAQFDASRMLRLPHAAGGHPRTGLTKPCAAHVNFALDLPVEQIEGQPLLQVRCAPAVSSGGTRCRLTEEELYALARLYRVYWDARTLR